MRPIRRKLTLVMHQAMNKRHKWRYETRWLFEFRKCGRLDHHRQTLQDLRQHRYRTFIGQCLCEHRIHHPDTIGQGHREWHKGGGCSTGSIGLHQKGFRTVNDQRCGLKRCHSTQLVRVT